MTSWRGHGVAAGEQHGAVSEWRFEYRGQTHAAQHFLLCLQRLSHQILQRILYIVFTSFPNFLTTAGVGIKLSIKRVFARPMGVALRGACG
jgi:hypothetical protein